jgi:hypothetical protein
MCDEAERPMTANELEELIQADDFGFCCCGCPDENLLYILAGMELIADRPVDLKVSADFWKEKEKRVLALHGSRGAKWLFYYWLDSKELTEHGGSVPGWLTDRGRSVLERLRRWKERYDQESEDEDGKN